MDNQKQLLLSGFIALVVLAIAFGACVAFIGLFWKSKILEAQDEIWKIQHTTTISDISKMLNQKMLDIRKNTKKQKLIEKRAEIFRKAIFLTKAREQNIWNYRTAKKSKDKDGQWKYWERAQQLVCECDSMVGAVGIYFDKHGREMVKNYREGFQKFHDLISELGQAKRIEDLLPEETINKRTMEAIKTLNKNAKFYAHYLLGVQLEPPEPETESRKDNRVIIPPGPSFYDFNLDLKSGLQSHEKGRGLNSYKD